MKEITKGWAIAVTITVISLVFSSLFFAFKSPTILSKNGGNSTTMTDSSLPPTKLHNILLIANEGVSKIAPDNDLYPHGIWYNIMTFNGTIPGPLIIAHQGDMLRITLKNEGKLVHSLNFHAGFGPNQALSGAVNAGASKTWTMKVNYPGAFLYHCDGDNLNGIWEHIADGMYGGVVIRSPNKNNNNATQEFYVAFSEVYDTKAHSPFAATTNQSSSQSGNSQAAAAIGSFDMDKFIARKPDLILTNGMAFRFISQIGTFDKIPLNANAEVFHVKTGELTRWYIFNAGPRNNIAFNFGAGMVKEAVIRDDDSNGNYVDDSGGTDRSTMLDRQDGNNNNAIQGYHEIVNIPPGSGTIIEVTFPEPGTYFGNDHDVGSILYGAGFIVIAE